MKIRNGNLNKIILAFVIMSTTCTYGQNIMQKDIYGREIMDTRGKRINYNNIKIATFRNQENSTIHLKSANTTHPNCVKDTINAKFDNLYSVMGTSIGRNSMHSIDVDGDGLVELICTASSQCFGLADYWYLMHYNSNDSTCDQIWTSPQFPKKITTLEIIDLHNDRNYEIFLCFEDGTIRIHDGKTKKLIKEVHPVNEKINSLVFADADNDSNKDFVISCERNTYVLDANTFEQKYMIAQGASCVRVGNIDSDSNNEIVLSSGIAYQISNSVLSTIWRFNTSSDELLELSDIDKDLKLEIIFAESWGKIDVYDADTKTTKYTISTDREINTLCLKDINNDGVDEILYGDGQWGKIFCYNSVTQAKIWSVNNPEHGVAAINYADLNNDGKQELIWSAGWTSTGSDYVYIYNVSDNKLLWRSADIVGPFYAIATGDVDKDGKDEIVAVSYESESSYGSGVLLIIDSQTNKLKWKSDGNFLYLIWTGIYNVSVKDIDSDGQNEIIIAAGQTYTGEIWIIDGKNHSIKSKHIFSSDNISEFYSLTVDDVDNDGKQELLAVSSSTLYAINPSDWSIKWRVNTSSSSDYSKSIVKCADLNGDSKKEVIICKGSIQIVNGSDHSIWTTAETNYLNIGTFDYNTDGTLDIVASTANGHIVTIDGKTKAVLKDINPETTEISSVKMQKKGSSNIYIYSCDGRINYYKNDTSCIVTQLFGNKIGEFEGFKFFDEKSDTSALIIGTSISVLKISGKSISCVDFNLKADKEEVSCNKNDGKIKLEVSGGSLPYEFLWNDNSHLDSLTNLKPGKYMVTVRDNEVCVKTMNISLPQATIDADLHIVNESCIEKGSVHVDINHINAPYTIKWSNSETGTEIKNLVAGNYNVSIIDSKNCKYERVANVLKDTVIVSSYVKNVSCYGQGNGYINLIKVSGTGPLTYKWDVGGVSGNLNNLKAGKYNVSVKDSVGCESKLAFEITQPNKISYDILVSPDDLSTPNWEGKIMIENISGGTSPYQIFWPRFLKYSDYLDVLPVGEYAFTLSDANCCQVKDTAVINSTGINNVDAKEFQVYPNPARTELFINTESLGVTSYGFELINSHGQIVKSNNHVIQKLERIDLTGFESGIYVLQLKVNNSLHYGKIVIQ